MPNEADAVIRAMAPFADESLTTSALRVLACTAEFDLGRALRRGDYRAAQEAAYAALQACAVLEKREKRG
jgi:hypothetical protein